MNALKVYVSLGAPVQTCTLNRIACLGLTQYYYNLLFKIEQSKKYCSVSFVTFPPSEVCRNNTFVNNCHQTHTRTRATDDLIARMMQTMTLKCVVEDIDLP